MLLATSDVARHGASILDALLETGTWEYYYAIPGTCTTGSRLLYRFVVCIQYIQYSSTSVLRVQYTVLVHSAAHIS